MEWVFHFYFQILVLNFWEISWLSDLNSKTECCKAQGIRSEEKCYCFECKKESDFEKQEKNED